MRYFIELAYKGTNYHGWQIQPNSLSVQQTIEECLSLLLRTPIKIVGAGRTDTGVHARQMFAHFDYEKPLEDDLIHRMNRFLPKDIVIYEIKKMNKNIHARFDALSRSYQYMISLQKNPFEMESSWQFYNLEIDVQKMNEASQVLFDYNDFTSFSKLHTDVKTNMCTIHHAEWKIIADKKICFEISADRFLRNMVRAIVGTLVEVGKGKLSLDDFRKIIEHKNRSKAGASAPAQGLFLTKVVYPKNSWYGE